MAGDSVESASQIVLTIGGTTTDEACLLRVLNPFYDTTNNRWDLTYTAPISCRDNEVKWQKSQPVSAIWDENNKQILIALLQQYDQQNGVPSRVYCAELSYLNHQVSVSRKEDVCESPFTPSIAIIDGQATIVSTSGNNILAPTGTLLSARNATTFEWKSTPLKPDSALNLNLFYRSTFVDVNDSSTDVRILYDYSQWRVESIFNPPKSVSISMLSMSQSEFKTLFDKAGNELRWQTLGIDLVNKNANDPKAIPMSRIPNVVLGGVNGQQTETHLHGFFYQWGGDWMEGGPQIAFGHFDILLDSESGNESGVAPKAVEGSNFTADVDFFPWKYTNHNDQSQILSQVVQLDGITQFAMRAPSFNDPLPYIAPAVVAVAASTESGSSISAVFVFFPCWKGVEENGSRNFYSGIGWASCSVDDKTGKLTGDWYSPDYLVPLPGPPLVWIDEVTSKWTSAPASAVCATTIPKTSGWFAGLPIASDKIILTPPSS